MTENRPNPTAPGGMSKSALAHELRDEAGRSVEEIRAMTWPEMIDAVIAHRKTISDTDYDKCELHDIVNCADCTGVGAAFDASLDEHTVPSVTDMFDALEDDEDMFDDLAEFDDDEAPNLVPVEALPDLEVRAVEPQPIFLGLPDSKDYMFDGHFGIGPSGAERWMNCTASVAASRAFLERLTPNQLASLAEGSTAARQGTTAHAAAAIEANLMLGNASQEEYDAEILELTLLPESQSEAYDETMAEWITEYGDLIKSYADERGHSNVLIEARVEAVIDLQTMAADGLPEQHVITGSADMVALPGTSPASEKVLVVSDLKYGEGIDVSVEHNPQIRIYALGSLALLDDPDDVETIRYHIVQPRLGGIKTWEEPLNDLLDWRDEVLSPALGEARGGRASGAKFAPSDAACQWCDVRGACPALAEHMMNKASDLFSVIQETEYETGIEGAFPETETLSDERLGELLLQINGLTSIKDALKEEAQRRLHRGETVPGFKLVNYTPPRYWTEDAETLARKVARDHLSNRDALYKERALLTPTQAVAVLKKAGLDEHFLDEVIVKPEKKPVISTGPKDTRKEWAAAPPEQMFSVMGDDE